VDDDQLGEVVLDAVVADEGADRLT
jgi:hypothetical protein